MFKNTFYFSIIYFFILLIDLIVKINFDNVSYRYYSQPILLLILSYFYILNRNCNKKNFNLMLFALASFFIGRFFLLHSSNKISIAIGMVFFFIGKAFYAVRFLNHKDFKIKRLLPFFLFCFVYMVGILVLIYENLGYFQVPVLIYFFVSLLLAQFAFLRKGGVNYKSYILVFIGVLFSFISDGVGGINLFYGSIPFQKSIVTISFGLFQYFVVLGIIREEVIQELD